MNASIFVALIAFIACIVAINAQHRREHCLDDEFTTQVVSFAPEKRYDDLHEIYYSVRNQAQRIDIHEFHPHLRRVSVYLKHHEGKMYFVHPSESRCESHELHGKLEQHCLARNATHTATMTIGGSLKADVWEEEGFHGHHIRVALAAHNDVPINVFGRGGAHTGLFFSEYFNFKHGVEDPHQKFEVPHYCRRHEVENAPLSEEAKEYFKRAGELLTGFTME